MRFVEKLVVAGFTFFAVVTMARADHQNAQDRCKEEVESIGGGRIGDGVQITSSHQAERHKWALKCGYIDDFDVTSCDADLLTAMVSVRVTI